MSTSIQDPSTFIDAETYVAPPTRMFSVTFIDGRTSETIAAHRCDPLASGHLVFVDIELVDGKLIGYYRFTVAAGQWRCVKDLGLAASTRSGH